jgi:hypothetical protein
MLRLTEFDKLCLQREKENIGNRSWRGTSQEAYGGPFAQYFFTIPRMREMEMHASVCNAIRLNE